MPEWMTPELCPVWCRATRSSFSKSSTRVPGRREVISSAVARPTMPPPTIATSALQSMPARAHRSGGPGGSQPASSSLGDVGALGLDVHGIQGLARGHEQAVPLGTAEADVRADLRQADLADALAIRSEDVHAVVSLAGPAGPRPDVSVHVGADAVRRARLAGELHRAESASLQEAPLVHHVEDLDPHGRGPA